MSAPSIYSDEAKRLMQRDIAAWKDERARKKAIVIAALNEADLDDDEAVSILEGALVYGWEKPDGEWRESPKFKKPPRGEL